ncbi:hypothetical protein A9970_17720 [Sphingobacterium sp. UME9]|nr:hypothetical protein [Sphingobacterium sp. UME9]
MDKILTDHFYQPFGPIGQYSYLPNLPQQSSLCPTGTNVLHGSQIIFVKSASVDALNSKKLPVVRLRTRSVRYRTPSFKLNKIRIYQSINYILGTAFIVIYKIDIKLWTDL